MAFVFAVVNDLFFAERLSSGLHHLGHRSQVVDVSLDIAPPLPSDADLLLADLEAGESALTAIRAAKGAGIPALAFGPHVDLTLREKALQAGATKVVAKSKLTSSFPELVAELLTR